jgi:biopolymer transport protein ExbD
MKIKRSDTKVTEMDMTPMIDMTFQLVAFLMIMCNFSAAESDDRVKLPSSALAIPVETAPEDFFGVQMTKEGETIIEGKIVPDSGIHRMLLRKAEYFKSRDKAVSDVTIFIRAHEEAPAGKLQALIKECQRARFEKFVLRVKEQLKH